VGELTAKQGPKYQRWALVEAATPRLLRRPLPRPLPADESRIAEQRGAKVAQIDLARRLSEAIWHMLSRNQPFAPKGATDSLAA
jgi:transposase